MTDRMSAEARYADLEDRLLRETDAQRPSKPGFGSNGLWAGGKLFVMLTNGRLVVKLPRRRVDELVDAGDGERFDPGHGRVMKEWLSLNPESLQDWFALAREALDYAVSRSR